MKILELKELVKTRYLSMYDIVYQNKKGNQKSWMLATRKTAAELHKIFFEKTVDAADAVVVVAFHTASKSLVCIKQFRLPINDYIYELPAGLIDPGETISTTTVRELKEETGLDLDQILQEPYGDKLYLTPGMTDESIALVFCTCSGDVSTDHLEPDEDITPYLVNKEQAKEILASDTKMDVKFYLILSNFINGIYDNFFK
ncbi:NUDIX hydrolase [Candidatus Epulonipiscium viviparus]|uniref:NUDIX hydrolase n=1 Tax=Candidatus Epulonipiscium viviparus TaxID=420336 RepID=UPI00016C0B46|nr:NUDIX hydrolase [Candidatus Epulopiscium viviparus]